MKKRLVAFIMALAMVLTMVPIVALAEDLPNVTIVNDKIEAFVGEGEIVYERYWDEGIQDVVDDYSKPYTSYPINLLFLVETDEGQKEVPAGSYFDYQGASYCLQPTLYIDDIPFWQSYGSEVVVGQEYNGKVSLYRVGDSTPVKEDFLTFTFKVLENPIESFTIENITMIKDLDKNPNIKKVDTNEYGVIISSEYSFYDINSVELKATIKLSSQVDEIKTTIKDGKLETPIVVNGIEYSDVEINDNQTYDNQWLEAGNYTVTAKLIGFESSFYVTLTNSFIDSVDFDDLEIYEYTNGSYEPDGSFIYNPMVYMRNIYVKGELFAEGPTSAIYYNGNNCESTLVHNQIENPFKVGKYEEEVNIAGYSDKINFEIKKLDIADKITVIPNKVYVEENPDGYYEPLPDFKVVYTDGSVGFSPAEKNFIGSKVDCYGEYYEKSIEDYLRYSWYPAEGYEQFNPDPWQVGNTYKMNLWFAGKQYEYEVEVIPNKIKSIEIIDMPNCYLDENGWPKVYEIADSILLNVNYQNGTSEEIYYDGERYEDFSYNYNLEDGTITVSYKGFSDNKPLNIVDNVPVEKIEIDKSTMPSAYLIDGEYYFSPTNFDVYVTFIGEKNPVKVTIEDPYMGGKVSYKGDTFTVNCIKNFTDQGVTFMNGWTDNDHPFSVSIDDVWSNSIEVDVVDNVKVSSVKVLQEQTREYYKKDSLFSDCMDSTFIPFDFSGLIIEVTMTNGDKIELYGDNTVTNEGDSFSDWGISNGIQFRLLRETEGYTAHMSLEALGTTLPLYDIVATDSGISSIEVLNSAEMKQKFEDHNAQGLKFKVSFDNGKPDKTITLDEEENGWIGVGLSGIGDGGITPVDERAISGMRYSWYKIGNEYVSIIWNNNLLRFYDQILFLDTGKTMNLNSDLAEGTVEVSSDTIMNDVIDQLSLENRYKVEQQGMDINTQISVNSTDASKDILKLAKKDDATIEAAYAIDLAYTLDGETLELTELGDGKVAVKIKLPDELVGKDNIVVYREHTNPDGTVTVEEIQGVLSEDGKYVTFESSKFSTFALGYKDKKDVPPGGNGGTNEKPALPEAVEKIANTLDNTPIAATMMLVCSSGLCLFAVARKRKELE